MSTAKKRSIHPIYSPIVGNPHLIG